MRTGSCPTGWPFSPGSLRRPRPRPTRTSFPPSACRGRSFRGFVRYITHPPCVWYLKVCILAMLCPFSSLSPVFFPYFLFSLFVVPFSFAVSPLFLTPLFYILSPPPSSKLKARSLPPPPKKKKNLSFVL